MLRRSIKMFLIITFFIILSAGIITGQEIAKYDVFYYPDSDEIKTNSIENVNQIIKVLKENESYIITLKGYTNSLGQPEDELDLSFRRSNRIALMLKDSGISLNRIKSEGYGSKNLKEQKVSEANRRVEVFLYKTDNETSVYKKDIRKFKITVLNKQNNQIFADISIKQPDNNEAKETKYSIAGPRVIDLPDADKLEFTIASTNYETKTIVVNRNEEEKTVILEEKSEKPKKPKNFKKESEPSGYSMGSDKGNVDEKPVHKVKVNSFFIARYEVTQKEWNEVMDKNPSIFFGDNYPVHNISWYDAIEYCNKRSLKEGLSPCYKIDKDKIDENNKNKLIDKYRWTVECNFNADGYRLPTEAEWEFAARGGDKSKNKKYSGSNLINDVALDTGDIFVSEINVSPADRAKFYRTFNIVISPVGKTMPNELNLYDMSGNALEWCWDWYDKNYYKNSENDNPKGPESGYEKVIRGGSNRYYRDDCRVSVRKKSKPFTSIFEKREIEAKGGADNPINILKYNYIGLRVVKTIK